MFARAGLVFLLYETADKYYVSDRSVIVAPDPETNKNIHTLARPSLKL
jgi:hypothetical protein